VFRITDRPEIHSKGFHIYFDVKSDAIGFNLPHWMVENTERTESGYTLVADGTRATNWMTRIVLPLKDELRDRRQSFSRAAPFKDIHPSLLFFLHRLRSITIINKLENYRMSMIRKDIGDVSEIKHAVGLDRWLVVRRLRDASKISAQAKSGVEVESTEIALAFPLFARETSDPLARTLLSQSVFAFLPLRSYGFRFIMQGDFEVNSAREDVDRDSIWNQWVRSQLHHTFVDALDVFKVGS